MNAVEVAPAADAPDEGRKPVALVLVGYLTTILLPTIGILFALVALTRPGRWAKKQGLLMVGLATLLIAFGIALLPMLSDSYFAGKAQQDLRAVTRQAQREEEESNRKYRAQITRLHREEAVTEARIRQLRRHGGR